MQKKSSKQTIHFYHRNRRRIHHQSIILKQFTLLILTILFSLVSAGDDENHFARILKGKYK